MSSPVYIRKILWPSFFNKVSRFWIHSTYCIVCTLCLLQSGQHPHERWVASWPVHQVHVHLVRLPAPHEDIPAVSGDGGLPRQVSATVRDGNCRCVTMRSRKSITHNQWQPGILCRSTLSFHPYFKNSKLDLARDFPPQQCSQSPCSCPTLVPPQTLVPVSAATL